MEGMMPLKIGMAEGVTWDGIVLTEKSIAASDVCGGREPYLARWDYLGGYLGG